MQQIEKLSSEVAQNIRYVLMDIDDTITVEGKLPAVSLEALWALHDNGLVVVPITGRPAGWCDLIARQWPVHGVVGENGALVYWEQNGHIHRMYHQDAQSNDNAILDGIKQRCLAEVPGCRVAGDQFCRMFDLAIDFAEEEPRLLLEDARKIKAICEEEGALAKISSIHVNTWLGQYDKLGMAIRFLSEQYGYDDALDRDQVIYFGDSPNDEPMFAHFPQSVGVASINRYTHLLTHLPAYITQAEGGVGFAQGIGLVLGKRGN